MYEMRDLTDHQSAVSCVRAAGLCHAEASSLVPHALLVTPLLTAAADLATSTTPAVEVATAVVSLIVVGPLLVPALTVPVIIVICNPSYQHSEI